jgi:hypothetical protein
LPVLMNLSEANGLLPNSDYKWLMNIVLFQNA